MGVYYNEFDKKKCAALTQLMADGHISKGDIDDRPIQEVTGSDLKGYERCHFFAGIGLWDYALNIAGWKKDRPVWTGSCPCQPYSSAGRQKGKADDRHLWPEWERLIKECRPTTIFGEQVASSIAFGWLDDVYQGLEAEGYAAGSAVLPACSVGAPHKRDRLWFVAIPDDERAGCITREASGQKREPLDAFANGVRQTHEAGLPSGINARSASIPVVQSLCEGLERYTRDEEGSNQQRRYEAQSHGSSWKTGVWIDCPDGKQRLVEPGIPLLAHGYPERVGIIHSAGDAIVPQVAATFIQTVI